MPFTLWRPLVASAADWNRDFDPLASSFNKHINPCSNSAAATWAHHAIAHENDRKGLEKWLDFLAIGLGALFTIFQIYEYTHASFSFSGNIYGASFFMATGFHGFHVLIGTIFLLVCLIRAKRAIFRPRSISVLKLHFVDVVWLFLFAAIYIWGA